MTETDPELPPIPDHAPARIRAAFKKYRTAAEKAMARCRAAEKQQKFVAGQLLEAKEAERRTYERLLEALSLLAEYRIASRQQMARMEAPND